ncbi:MAG: response regulator transcription factor [Candidatus Obscuribacterales bacterium]
MAKILLVEDENDLARLIQNWLQRERNLVEIAPDGVTALHRLKTSSYDVIILDIMLPGISGVELCRMFRQRKGTTPVLIITARTSLQDKEQGFLAGADDYLTKPFHLKELEYRVKALVRRGKVPHTDMITVGKNIVVNCDRHQVTRNGKEIKLLPKEFRLLEFLARHPNRVFSSDELIENVWESDSNAQNDTVRGHITRLRKKLDTQGDPSIIVTVYGVGYKLNTEEVAAAT